MADEGGEEVSLVEEIYHGHVIYLTREELIEILRPISDAAGFIDPGQIINVRTDFSHGRTSVHVQVAGKNNPTKFTIYEQELSVVDPVRED